MTSNVKIIMEKNLSGLHTRLDMVSITGTVLYVVTLLGS